MDQQPTFHIIQGLRFVSACLLLLVACNTYASNQFPLPENHQSTYSITKYGTEVGQIKNDFQYHDQQIIYTSKAIATGVTAFFLKEIITETSHLYWPDDNTLEAPQQISYRLQHKKNKKKDQEIYFVWSDVNHVDISSSYKNKSATLTSDKIVWSSQLLPILMSSYLLHNDKITDGSFLIANKNNLENYNFTLEGHEPIELNGKMHSCLKFKIIKQDSSRYTYAWLSKNHYYLPLKMEQYKDNELNASIMLKQFKLLK